MAATPFDPSNATFTLSNGQTMSASQYSQLYPGLYAKYIQNYSQPQADLNQTQSSTANTQAAIPGTQAESGIKQVQQQQTSALQNLNTDLKKNKMTLPDAMSKYKALNMSPDQILSQYISESPYGFPKQNIAELQNMGVSDKLLGDINNPGSIRNRSNVLGVMNELDSLNDYWNQVSGTSALENALHLPLAGADAAANYNTKKTDVMQHVLSAIPGSSAAQTSTQKQIDEMPDPMDPGGYAPGKVKGIVQTIKQTLLQQNKLNPEDIGLSPKDFAVATNNQGSTKGGDLLNGILQTALPTAGAIGGGAVGGLAGAAIPGADLTGVPEVAGGIAGASAGGAGGQALADMLTGKKPGSDVATTAVLSGVGQGAGAALGGILGKAGSAFAPKIADNVFDKVVSASPNYTTDVQALKNTANKYGLMTAGNSAQALSKMPKVMSDIGEQIQTKLAGVTKPVNLQKVSTNILNDFSKKTNAFENSQDFKDAQEYIKNRLYSATGNDNPLSSILGGNGKPMEKNAAQTTYSDLYKLKSAVADDLKPVFKAQANPALNTNFTPKQEANLALWNGLKSEIDKADPEIRILNNDQHNMFDIAKGFFKSATGGKGAGGGVMGDIFDVLAGSMVGGLPISIGTHIVRKSLSTEGGRIAISKLLQGGSNISKGTGGAVGGALGGILGLNQ